MSLEDGTAEDSAGVSKSKIPLAVDNGNVWQPAGELWDSDFYLHQRAFPRTWGTGMQ